MPKLFDSDWLRAMQFKCNTSAESVTPGFKKCNTSANYTKDLLKENGKFSKPMRSSKTMTKIFYGNFEKSFFECEKIASRKILRYFRHANFFMHLYVK